MPSHNPSTDSQKPEDQNDESQIGRAAAMSIEDEREYRNLPRATADGFDSQAALAALRYRDAVLHAITLSAAALVTSNSLDEGAPKALEIVGKALDVDRILVIEYTEPVKAAQPVSFCFGWQAPGAAVKVGPDFLTRYPANSPEVIAWMTRASEGKSVPGSIRDMHGAVRELFEALQIKSILLVPIRVAGKVWGNIGIDSCREEREWSQTEIDVLETLAEIIGSAIVRERYLKQLAAANSIINATPTVLFRLSAAANFPLTSLFGNVEWFGHAAAELLSRPTLYQQLIHPDDQARVIDALSASRQPASASRVIDFRVDRNGTYLWVEGHLNPIRDQGGNVKEIEGIIVDITERKNREDQILFMARFDPLTGLFNRTVFVDWVQKAVARVKRGGKGFAILYLDLDHFKDVNDTLGHPVGDLLLKAVAERLRSKVRETDVVARFGGDEFAVMQTDVTDPADASVLARKLIDNLSQPYSIEGNLIRLGASIGIAMCGPDALDAESLLSYADVALYRAKAEGRSKYRFFTESMDAEVRSRFILAAQLREAIAGDQLFLVYQPQADAATGRIIGLEALLRWRHPQRGLLRPSEFISAAEHSGLIIPLGQKVLREACRQMKRWVDARIAPLTVSVNISAIQFKAPLELEQSIAAVLGETELPAKFLELELTETVLMETSFEHNDVLQRLKEKGIRLAIDDFGTGFSSFDYLRRYPVSRIKISQHFVKDILRDASNAAIVKAIIGLARELHIDFIAEGVETAAQANQLREWGCRHVQGFYFAKPMSATELAPLLLQGTIQPTLPETAHSTKP
jgi:diguanylate cyclase (GGDEF)-like protein/PAS domain S-box-containing protein